MFRGQNQFQSCCLSVMLSPPNPFDEIQPNLVCELLTNMGRATAKKKCPAPWGPGEGSKDQLSFNFNDKVDLKDFYTNFLFVLTKERYKTYQTGFLFCRLGHALWVGLGVLRGPKCSSVRWSIRYAISS